MWHIILPSFIHSCCPFFLLFPFLLIHWMNWWRTTKVEWWKGKKIENFTCVFNIPMKKRETFSLEAMKSGYKSTVRCELCVYKMIMTWISEKKNPLIGSEEAKCFRRCEIFFQLFPCRLPYPVYFFPDLFYKIDQFWSLPAVIRNSKGRVFSSPNHETRNDCEFHHNFYRWSMSHEVSKFQRITIFWLCAYSTRYIRDWNQRHRIRK